MNAVERTRIQVEGISTRLLQAGPAGAEEAVVFMHGNPGSADDWEDLIAAVSSAPDRGPVAAPDAPPALAVDAAPALAGTAAQRRALAFDLPDFGETVAAPGFEHDVFSYASFTDAALGVLGVRRAHLVVHDFGGPIGLVWAARHAERLASVTLIDTGILPGYRWHRMARIWRTPVLGELMQAVTFRAGFRRTIAAGEPRGLPREFVEKMYDQYDRRTRKAVLELYRATDDPGTAAAEFSAFMAPKDIPALVIWGEHDAYLPSSYAYRQREAFPSADVHVLPASGHWPFADAPETVQRLLVEFLGRLAQRAPAA
jgi:pimeloyl-ACP methyl ester carboxylesterase